MSERQLWGSEQFERATARRFDQEVQQVAALAARLCAVPSITVPAAATDFHELANVASIASDFARSQGLRVYQPETSDQAPYPFVAVTFAEHALESPATDAVIALIGHLDVVPPKEEGQFAPYLEGVDLYARGAADMKTVVASYLVWMARWQARPGPRPPIVLLLSCCEENGSCKPNHMGSALQWLQQRFGVEVRFAVVGERTGELEWMHPELEIGPICRENRSWRWIRAEGRSVAGIEAFERIARVVELGRTTIHRLNEEHTPADKKQRQPGVRSGFVNSFCFVAADEGLCHQRDVVWLGATRSAGASVHSAAAQASQPSLVEQLWVLAQQAIDRFGRDNVFLAGVEVGQDGNFNTYDGSGVMRLALAGVALDQLRAWGRALAPADLELAYGERPLELTRHVTVAGFDIRELLDHREAVEELLETMRGGLFGAESFRALLEAPPWRCSEDHPDLVALAAAYQEVIGQRSEDLVKLHGNDGGNLAAYRRRVGGSGVEPGVAPIVVFGQVGMRPHGPGEFHRLTSVRPYLDVLDRWAAALC